MLDIGLYVGYGLFAIAALAAIILPLINSLRSPSVLIKSGISLAVLLVLFLIAYGVSGSEVTPAYISAGVDEGSSKLIGAGLTTFYFLFIGAAVGIIVTEINKAFK